jgi:hypothetical protein
MRYLFPQNLIFKTLNNEVLLLGGTRSPGYLKLALIFCEFANLSERLSVISYAIS